MRYILIPLLVCLSGCVRHIPVAVSSSSIGSKYEKPGAVVRGSSKQTFFFGAGSGSGGLLDAIDDAIANNIGHTLANTYVEQKVFCVPACALPIITVINTDVHGTLVQYIDDNGNPLPMAQKEEKPVYKGIQPLNSPKRKMKVVPAQPETEPRKKTVFED